MSTPKVGFTAAQYEQAAARYCESLPPEHFMEATTQSVQREVTVDSYRTIQTHRADVHIFSELLIQYFFEGNLRQVVPDNMLVLGAVDEKKRGSWALELEPGAVFITMEYVSPSNRRKDYVDSYEKYERELKVPYYLLVDPDRDEVRLHRHDGDGYDRVPFNLAQRLPVPELDLELGWKDGWVRYWFRGELVTLTQEKEGIIRSQREAIRQRDLALDHVLPWLRQRVEAKARVAGRDDILAQLPAATDPALLTRWHDELGPTP